VSDGSQGPGWWLASDGRWYPPEAAPPTPTPTDLTPPSDAVGPPVDGGPVTAPAASPNPAAPPYPYAAAPPYPYPTPTPYPGAPPYGYGPVPMGPPPKFSPMAIWAFVLVIVLGGFGALVGIPLAFVARSSIKRSNGTQKGAGLALAALIIGFAGIALFAVLIVIGATYHPGPSLPDLTADARAQITGTGSDGFGVKGVSRVVCNPPSEWTPGATFTCFAYDSSDNELGEYDGTVEPDASDGTYQWNANWVPSG